VSDAGIHRNPEIQFRYKGGRFGEAFQLIAEMKKVAASFQQRSVAGADVVLQADKTTKALVAGSLINTGATPGWTRLSTAPLDDR